MTIKKDLSTKESREEWRKIKELGKQAPKWYREKIQRNLGREESNHD